MLRKFHLIDCRIEECPADEATIQFYINPTDEEKRYLIDDLKIDEHTLTSALDPDELSRLEFEPEHVALIFKRPKNYSGGGQLPLPGGLDRPVPVQGPADRAHAEDMPLFEGKLFSRVPRLPEVMLQADLPLHLPFPRAPEDHQPDLRRAGAEDQRVHGEQATCSTCSPWKRAWSIISTPSTPTPWSSRSSRTTPPRSASPPRSWSSSTTSSSRTTSATSRPRSIPTSWPA